MTERFSLRRDYSDTDASKHFHKYDVNTLRCQEKTEKNRSLLSHNRKKIPELTRDNDGGIPARRLVRRTAIITGILSVE